MYRELSKVYLLLLFCLVLICGTLLGCAFDPGTVEGHAISESGGDVSGIEIFLMGSNDELEASTETDTKGYYRMTDVSSGEYNMLASRNNRFYYDAMITVRSGETTVIDFSIP